MGGKQIKPPMPAKLLYENVFVRRDREGSLELLSEGLVAFAENAARLIDDAVLLVKAERYGTAAFLVATADEEMAKSYILLDACRLDFSRYESVLRSLCRAFYSHVAKHAYSKVTRFKWHNMAHVKEVWDVETTRWWSSPGYESGEPDMPHETYFEREMPLYVDFVDQDQKWFTPRAGTRKYVFEDAFAGHDALSESQAALE